MFKDKNAIIIPEHVIDEKQKVVDAYDVMCRKRKKIFKTMFDTIQEQTGMKTDELYEQFGMEPLILSKN